MSGSPFLPGTGFLPREPAIDTTNPVSSPQPQTTLVQYLLSLGQDTTLDSDITQSVINDFVSPLGESFAISDSAAAQSSSGPYTYDNGYPTVVLSDSPSLYWRLDQPSGTLVDSSGNGHSGTIVAGPITSAFGEVPLDRSTALTLDGATQYAYANASVFDPQNVSLECWFKTTSTAGGRLIGLSSSQTGASATADRHIYSAGGALFFGVVSGGTKYEVVGAGPGLTPLNDGNWHHVVATLSTTAGLTLYIDGAPWNQPTPTSADSYTGYWRIGYDNIAGWNGASGNYWGGTLDEVAVYNSVLSQARVTAHYNAGKALGTYWGFAQYA